MEKTSNPLKTTILIVDDTPTNLTPLIHYVAEQGYIPLVAESGESALEQLEHNLPDLILLDVMMPDLDGFGVCQIIKQNPRTQNIPVIFMTALDATQEKVKGFEVGAVDYITKPIQYAELMARIKTHLTVQKLQKSLKEANKHLEERVAERTESLKNTIQEFDTFLYRSSHDLRGPLTTLMGLANIAQIQTNEEATQDILQRAVGTIKNMDSLLQKLQQVSEIYQTETTHIPIDLVKLLQEIWQEVKQKFPTHSAKLVFMEVNLPKIYTSKELLSIIFLNIIENAFYFSKRGVVTMKVGAEIKQNRCYLILEDEGIGIAPEYQSKVFEMYFRANVFSQGNGLGLYLVKKAVEKLQGKVWLKSQEGEFAKFFIEIPLG